MRRRAVVADKFYDGDPAGLETQVRAYVEDDRPTERVKCVLSPHAGLIYSGSVAGAVFSAIEMPDTAVLIGPNHTGNGANISIMYEGNWEIPTATMDIDGALAKRIMKHAPMVESDESAHMYEHSLEVQLPFLAHFSRGVKIVPITIMSATLPELRALGDGLAESIEGIGYRVLTVASSDMSHYVPDETAKKKDKLAIDRMLAMDPDGLYKVVRRESITMCGYMPAVVMLQCAIRLGATEARLVKYTTSAEVSGDYDHVVGYAGMIFK